MSDALAEILGSIMSQAWAAFVSWMIDVDTIYILGGFMILYIGWGFFSFIISWIKNACTMWYSSIY